MEINWYRYPIFNQVTHGRIICSSGEFSGFGNNQKMKGVCFGEKA
jgi:proteasome assembly chaperone (PAC2) family protein